MKIYTRDGSLKQGTRCGLGPASFLQANATPAVTLYRPLGVINYTALSTLAMTANSMRAQPFVSPCYPITLDTIRLTVTTQAAGKVMLVGIYDNINVNDSISMYPGNLLWSSSELSTAGTAPFTLDSTGIGLVLLPGRLYWVVVWGNTTATFRAPAIGALPVTLGTTILGTSNIQGWTVAATYTAGVSVLQPTFPATGVASVVVTTPGAFALFLPA